MPGGSPSAIAQLREIARRLHRTLDDRRLIGSRPAARAIDPRGHGIRYGTWSTRDHAHDRSKPRRDVCNLKHSAVEEDSKVVADVGGSGLCKRARSCRPQPGDDIPAIEPRPSRHHLRSHDARKIKHDRVAHRERPSRRSVEDGVCRARDSEPYPPVFKCDRPGIRRLCVCPTGQHPDGNA